MSSAFLVSAGCFIVVLLKTDKSYSTPPPGLPTIRNSSFLSPQQEVTAGLEQTSCWDGKPAGSTRSLLVERRAGGKEMTAL